jgi:hypothetical protein
LQHDLSSPPEPGQVGVAVTYRFAVTVDTEDFRLPALELVMARLREVLSAHSVKDLGPLVRRLSGSEEKSASGAVANVPASRRGAARKTRTGTLVDREGTVWSFDSMKELARILQVSYPNLTNRYLQLCRESNADPDSVDNLVFHYRGARVTLTAKGGGAYRLLHETHRERRRGEIPTTSDLP